MMINFRNFQNIFATILYIVCFGVQILCIALGCSAVQPFYYSITFVQYIISLGFALITVSGSYLITLLLGMASEVLDPELRTSLNFD